MPNVVCLYYTFIIFICPLLMFTIVLQFSFLPNGMIMLRKGVDDICREENASYLWKTVSSPPVLRLSLCRRKSAARKKNLKV